MDKELSVSKWVLIDWPNIPQIPLNSSAQIVCPSPKVFDEKRLRLASIAVSVPKNKITVLVHTFKSITLDAHCKWECLYEKLDLLQ